MGHRVEDEVHFYSELANERNLGSSSDIITTSGDFNGDVKRVLKVYMGEWYCEKKCGRKKIVGFCDERAVRGKDIIS